MYVKNKVQFILLLLFFNTISLRILAQDSSKEFWPEIDVWYKLTPSWRTSVLIPLSRNIETNYRQHSSNPYKINAKLNLRDSALKN